MYVTLFSIILVIGLLLLLLPINIYKKWFDNRVFPIVIRVIGIILCIIYAVLSGEIVLPLIK